VQALAALPAEVHASITACLSGKSSALRVEKKPCAAEAEGSAMSCLMTEPQSVPNQGAIHTCRVSRDLMIKIMQYAGAPDNGVRDNWHGQVVGKLTGVQIELTIFCGVSGLTFTTRAVLNSGSSASGPLLSQHPQNLGYA